MLRWNEEFDYSKANDIEKLDHLMSYARDLLDDGLLNAESYSIIKPIVYQAKHEIYKKETA